MARKRKTVDVSALLAEANRLLAHEDNIVCNPSFRKGVAALIEKALMSTGNYQGFQFLTWEGGGFAAWEAAGRPGFPEKDKYIGDETKRRYLGEAGPLNHETCPMSLDSFTGRGEDAPRDCDEERLAEEGREDARLHGVEVTS